MGDYTQQINYKGLDHIDATYYEKKQGEVVTSTLWNAVLGALVTRSNAYDTALQQTAAFESNFLSFQQEYREFTQSFEVFRLSRVEFESNTTARFSSLESAIGSLQVGQSTLEAADDAIRAALTVFDTDINTLRSDVDQCMTRSEVCDYVADELSKIKLVEVVATLPEKGETNKLYLLPVPVEDTDEQDLFFEYVWTGGTWERLGTKQIKINLDEYIKNTDYATSNKAGVMKVGTGLVAMGDGVVQIYPALENDIDGKVNIKAITPQYLDYAVKSGVTTNKEILTEEEKASACEWLGINSLVGDVDEALDEIIEIIESLKDEYTGGVPKEYVDGIAAEAVQRITYIEENYATKVYVDNAVASVSGGVSSWNDLTDKPFYEGFITTILDYSNLPTVSGVLPTGSVVYKVTDDILTSEQLEGSVITAEVTNTDGNIHNDALTLSPLSAVPSVQLPLGTIYYDDMLIESLDKDVTFFISVAEQEGTFDFNGTSFTVPETGTYLGLMTHNGETQNSMSLEYNGIKTLDIKFIPDSLYTEIDQRIENYIDEALGGEY